MRLVLSKLLQLIPVLALVIVATSLMLELVPGDPAVAVLGTDADPARYAEVREQLGLEAPLRERMQDWIGDLARGDLGQSILPPHRDVSNLIGERLPVTLELAVLSLLLSLLVAVPLAMRTAFKPGDGFDTTVTGFTFGAISIPSFLVGLLLVYFFVFNFDATRIALAVAAVVGAVFFMRSRLRVRRESPGDRTTATDARTAAGVIGLFALGVLLSQWDPNFPRQGFVRLTEGRPLEHLRSITLPVLTLALTETAVFLRLLRGDLMHTLDEPYVLAARARGMSPSYILRRHALRPSCFSLITVISVSLGRVVGGAIIVESIFNVPGMGRLMVDSISVNDFPVVQAAVLIIAVSYVITSVFVELMYTRLDPRLRRRVA